MPLPSPPEALCSSALTKPHSFVRAGSWQLRLAVALLCAGQLAPAFAGLEYDTLIEQARAGTTTPALEYLRREVPNGGSPKTAVADWIEIASWSGFDTEVIEVYQTHASRSTLSARTLAAVARSYRNLKKWTESASLYEAALALEPQNTELLRGYIHVLADGSQDAQALDRANTLVAQAPMDAKRRVTLAYVHTAGGRHFAALTELTRARSLAPDDKTILAEYVRALQTAGIPTVAKGLADLHPSLLAMPQYRRLQGDVGAELVRLAFEPHRTEAERFAIADKALAHYNKLLADWTALPSTADIQAAIVRIRIDRLGAFTARSRMDEATQEYEDLKKSGAVIPVYAVRWIAGAYLYKRQPDIARDLYRVALEQSEADGKRNNNDVTGLFYALLETEAMDEALALMERKAADNPSPLAFYSGSSEGIPNSDWADAQQELAQAHAFADNGPEAQLRLEQMLSRAPGNSGLRTALAGVYRGRAWPRRAEEELKLVETMSPRNLGLELQQGFTALDLQEWRQLDLLADDIIERYPENLQAQRLDRLRDIHHSPEIRVSGYRGLSDSPGNGINPAIGRGEYGLDTAIYSSPIKDNWRLFAGFGWGRGEFTEGRGLHRTLRGGAEWRERDNTVEAEVSSHSFGFGRKAGLRLEGRHDFNDQWQVGAGLERLSRATPLRALTSNITADSANVFVRWRAHDRREWGASLTPMDYSDGNRGINLSINGRERLYTHPYFYADAVLNMSASRNSQQTGPYFSPESDFTFLPSLDMGHIIYRNYQTEWRQQLQLGVGTYSQRDFSSDSIESISYGHRYRFNDVFEAGWKLSWIRRPYDGQREKILRGTYDLIIKY